MASLKLGNQIEAEWVPLLGITCDPKNDLVEVLPEGLDTDDVRQIIRLRDPIMLPYSHSH